MRLFLRSIFFFRRDIEIHENRPALPPPLYFRNCAEIFYVNIEILCGKHLFSVKEFF